MSALQIPWDSIRRRWALILVIALVAAAGALGASALQGTTYTGRASLTVVSLDRPPEEDSVLAQGYANLFNTATTQQTVRQTTGIPSSVQLNSRIAASAPIVYVEAQADDEALAADSATKAAGALRDTVNEGLRGDAGRRIADLERQLEVARAANDSDQVGQLKSNIGDLQRGANQLQDLQIDGGVVADAPDTAQNTVTALIGALILGALIAVALGRLDGRVVTSSQVSAGLGLPVLAEVGRQRRPSGNSSGDVTRALLALTNAYGMPRPGSLAVTGPESVQESKTRLAVALAGLRAAQGQTTMLLQTDRAGVRRDTQLASLPGVVDFLAERAVARLDEKVYANGRALLVAPFGNERDDVFTLFSKLSFQRLLQQGHLLADLVIIDAPPIESAEGQVVCSAADRSLIVVEMGDTRVRDLSDAVDALGRVGATALGAVTVDDVKQLEESGLLPDHGWNPVRLPVMPPAGRRPVGPPPADGPHSPVPPADRTAPISQKMLDEARAALARDPENISGAMAAAASGAPQAGPGQLPANGHDSGGGRREDEGAGKPGAAHGPDGKDRGEQPPRDGAGRTTARPGPDARPANGSPGPAGVQAGPGVNDPGSNEKGTAGGTGPGSPVKSNGAPPVASPNGSSHNGKLNGPPPSSKPNGPTPSGTPDGSTPAKPNGPTPTAKPNGSTPAKPNGPTPSGTPNGSTPAKPNGPTPTAKPNGSTPAKPNGPTPSGTPNGSTSAKPNGPTPTPAGRPTGSAAGSSASDRAGAPSARSAADSRTGGAPGPSGSGQRTTGSNGPGQGGSVAREHNAKPSPRPKAEPQSARGVSSAPKAGGTKASQDPGAPEGARRIGTARFSTAGGASAASGSRGPGASAEPADERGENGLSAPTVTLRTEK